MSDVERTLVLIKPDGVRKYLVGEIIGRFEKKGLMIEQLKMMTLTPELATKHYSEHQGKMFFESLIQFITSGSIVAMVISGEKAISVVRKMCGTTDPSHADAGTIRGDFALSVTENIIHASDSSMTAKREIELFFG